MRVHASLVAPCVLAVAIGACGRIDYDPGLLDGAPDTADGGGTRADAGEPFDATAPPDAAAEDGAISPDAPDANLDAGPPPVEQRCRAGSLPCSWVCDAADCRFRCESGTVCEATCPPGALCRMDCDLGATCDLTCEPAAPQRCPGTECRFFCP